MNRLKTGLIMGFYHSIPMGIGCLVINELYDNPIGKRFFPNRVAYGYKGTRSDMTSIYEKIKYQLGKEYIHQGYLVPCYSGFHLCEDFFDVEDYYPMVSQGQYTGYRYFLVEYNLDNCKYEGNKTVSNKLKLIEELGTVGGEIPTKKNIYKIFDHVPKHFSPDQRKEYLLNWYRVFCYKYYFVNGEPDPFFRQVLYREKDCDCIGYDDQEPCKKVIYDLKILGDELGLDKITHDEKNYIIKHLISIGLCKSFVMEYAIESNDRELTIGLSKSFVLDYSIKSKD